MERPLLFVTSWLRNTSYISSGKISYISVLLCGCMLYFVGRRKKSLNLPYPPGPKPLPVLGNLLDMPVTSYCTKYAEWGKQYGDVTYVRALGKHIIVVNSHQAATELAEHRSTVYSDRPQTPMVHDPRLMNMDWIFIMKPYSQVWKKHRRLFTQHLNPNSSSDFYDMQIRSTNLLLKSFLDDPKEAEHHLRHAMARVILGIAYGLELQQKNDPFVAIAERMTRLVGEGLTPVFLVNIIPILKYIPSWFPGAGFRRLGIAAQQACRDLQDAPFEAVKQELAAGSMYPSFVRNALMEVTEMSEPERIKDIKEVAATIYAAGTDTTVSVIHHLLAALVVYPEVQRRAQEELDRVLGSANSASFRLPTFSDRPQLPYIDAVLKEALRWTPGAGFGVPHMTTQEDVYRGWRIPKGSIIAFNSWGILRDEKVYSDPNVFRPERFLASEVNPVEPDPAAAFGYGRRACPGKHLGETSLWIEIAALLACYNFTPAKDTQGNDIDLTYVFQPGPGFVLRPPDFPCTILPRSSYVVKVIQDTLVE